MIEGPADLMLRTLPALQTALKEGRYSVALILDCGRTINLLAALAAWTIELAIPPGVARLLPECAQNSQLFKRKNASNSNFSQNPHAHRSSLSRAHFFHPLLNQRFVGVVGIQYRFKRQVSIANTLVDSGSFGPSLFPDSPYLFALFGT
jgi:hypothetical protein